MARKESGKLNCLIYARKQRQTSEGKLPDPETLIAWTHNFFKIPEFTFGDLYNYLVSREDHSLENLRSFESRLGFTLFPDGQVVDLRYCPVEGKSFCFCRIGALS